MDYDDISYKGLVKRLIKNDRKLGIYYNNMFNAYFSKGLSDYYENVETLDSSINNFIETETKNKFPNLYKSLMNLKKDSGVGEFFKVENFLIENIIDICMISLENNLHEIYKEYNGIEKMSNRIKKAYYKNEKVIDYDLYS